MLVDNQSETDWSGTIDAGVKRHENERRRTLILGAAPHSSLMTRNHADWVNDCCANANHQDC